MAEGSVAATRAARRGPSLWATRAGHAAFAWAILFAGAGLDPDSGRRSSRWAMAPRRVPEHTAPSYEKRGCLLCLDVLGLAVEGFPPEQENDVRVTRHNCGGDLRRPRTLLYTGSRARYPMATRHRRDRENNMNETPIAHPKSRESSAPLD